MGSKPVRFWCNDDDDSSDSDHPTSTTKDSASDVIKSERDLEDFARLHLNIGGLQEAIAAGTITVGLEWRNIQKVGGSSPSIKIFQAAEADGGNKYITNENGDGSGNEHSAQAQIAAPFNAKLGTIDEGGGFKFKKEFWGVNGAVPKFDADHANRYLLFEGVTEGKGQLVMTFWKDTDKIGEGGGVWIDIKDIRKMYKRAEATGNIPYPPDYAYPNEGPPASSLSPIPKDEGQSLDTTPASWTEAKQYIIFVHGWNQDYAESKNYAETMFKRLWHAGYKGRFAFFRWPTLKGTVGTYNDSEYKAWESGDCLKQFVNSLESGYTKNLVAHSMGNIVAGSALKNGLSVTNYSLMNAALSAMCYDTSASLYQSGALWKTPTPDGDNDGFTKGLGLSGQLSGVSGNLTSFYLSRDFATTTAWEANNYGFKPQRFNGGATGYYYDPNAASGSKLGITFAGVAGRFVKTKNEAMAYSDHSRTKTVGADGRTHGPIQGSYNMDGYDFDTDHSAQFARKIQLTVECYNALLSSFGIFPAP